jgi:hypothetical protein
MRLPAYAKIYDHAFLALHVIYAYKTNEGQTWHRGRTLWGSSMNYIVHKDSCSMKRYATLKAGGRNLNDGHVSCDESGKSSLWGKGPLDLFSIGCCMSKSV